MLDEDLAEHLRVGFVKVHRMALSVEAHVNARECLRVFWELLPQDAVDALLFAPRGVGANGVGGGLRVPLLRDEEAIDEIAVVQLVDVGDGHDAGRLERSRDLAVGEPLLEGDLVGAAAGLLLNINFVLNTPVGVGGGHLFFLFFLTFSNVCVFWILILNFFEWGRYCLLMVGFFGFVSLIFFPSRLFRSVGIWILVVVVR